MIVNDVFDLQFFSFPPQQNFKLQSFSNQKKKRKMTTKESHIYNISDCLIDGVTVYQDRAEVTRSLKFIPQNIGQHEIIINSVTMTSVSLFIILFISHFFFEFLLCLIFLFYFSTFIFSISISISFYFPLYFYLYSYLYFNIKLNSNQLQ